MERVTNNLINLQKQIRTFEKKYSRRLNSVSLLAASKSQSVSKISQCAEAGQLIFGESYLQEALPKIEALADLPIEWHFIGRLQRNKTKKIAEHFSWVHSVADAMMAKRLNDQRPLDLPKLNICIEINLGHEATKSGTSILNAIELAEFCTKLPQLKLRGLMTIPPATVDIQKQRLAFHEIKILFDKLNERNLKLDTLSMGMSNDMEAAIAEGATIVRVGTAIFGARNKKISPKIEGIIP